MKNTCILFFALLIICQFSWAEPSVQYIRNNAVTWKNGKLPAALFRRLSEKRLILLGEIHGTKEMPEIAGALAEGLSKAGPLSVGVEFPIENQLQIDEFMKKGDESVLKGTPFFKDVDYGSGRTSVAMVSLLKRLRKLPSVSVFCFDIQYKSKVAHRDTAMAENVISYLRSHPKQKVLTYSGNLHSRINETYMGAEILKLSHGDLPSSATDSIYIRAGEGTMWACMGTPDGKIDCGIQTKTPLKNNYATAVANDNYFLHEPTLTDGHLETLFIRKISASRPDQSVLGR